MAIHPASFRNGRALVVLSGGQDSATCLFWALQAFDEVHAITFNYNQRHAIEIDRACELAIIAGLGNRHEIVPVGPILNGTSPLTSFDHELEQYDNFEQMDKVIGDRVEKTFVPMRNDLFLTLAANRAVCLGATAIVTGVCQADNANYPDCRQEFIDAKEQAINMALGFDFGDTRFISLATPLMNKSKAESILWLQSMGHFEKLAFTHTAYDGQYPPLGKDHATVLRAHGFEQAGLPDPLVLRAVDDGLMELPTTDNYAKGLFNLQVVDQINQLKKEHGLQ